MNPVLLKPNTDIGAQVIIQGCAIGTMNADAYHDYKCVAREAVLASYRHLCSQYSPAVYLDGSSDGALSENGQILGTYLHGLFESTVACNPLLRWAGLGNPQTLDYHAVRETHIDRLAGACETHLDLTAVARNLGIDTASGKEHAV
jgi:cobyric acid synthase